MIFLKKNIGYLKSKKKYLLIRLYWEQLKTKFYSSNFLKLKKKINQKIKKNKLAKQNILICTFSGTNYLIKMIDILFYVSLKLKGCNVYILKCSKFLDLCQISNYTYFKDKELVKNQLKLCDFCEKGFDIDFKDNFFKKIILTRDHSDDVKIIHKKKILRNAKMSESLFDEVINSAIIRFFGNGSLNIKSHKIKKIRESYILSGLRFINTFQKIIKKYEINKIINHHGIYLPHGFIFNLAKNYKINYYTWHQAYRKNSISIYKNDNQHNFYQNLTRWDNFKFTNNKKLKIKNYLKSRFTGEEDWVKFQPSTYKKKNKINSKETYFLATNVSWDAQIHFENNFFQNMEDFIIFTIKYFKSHPDKNLIIRCHPGELLGQVPSSKNISDFIKEKFINLPKNISIISSKSNINTYQVANNSDVIIVYASKISIEFASLGKPVICCGEAWIKNKGITFDPINRKEYLSFLNSKINVLQKIAKKRKNQGLKFAYYFFFKRTFFIKYIKKHIFPSYKMDLKNLIKITDRDKNLEVIVNSIINNKDVIK